MRNDWANSDWVNSPSIKRAGEEAYLEFLVGMASCLDDKTGNRVIHAGPLEPPVTVTQWFHREIAVVLRILHPNKPYEEYLALVEQVAEKINRSKQ